MAVSVHASSTLGLRVQGIPKTASAEGGAAGASLPRSQFLGSGRNSSAIWTRSTQVISHTAAKPRAIRSASFFEKLGRLFSSDPEPEQEQVLAVFEINDKDRGSPILLSGPANPKNPVLGSLVPYTNKVYDASAKRYLGLSAGLCTSIELLKNSAVRYETTYTHYIDDFGQLSAMGPYITTVDTEMVVTGGTGIFKGARGIVKLHSVTPPVKILYTYYLTGIQKLPSALTSPKEEAPPIPVSAKAAV